MSTFFIVISFIIHFLTIITLIILYQRKSLERANIPTLKEDVETIHDSIEAFVDEMEKENAALQDTLVQHFKERERVIFAKLAEVEHKLAFQEDQIQEPEKEPDHLVTQSVGEKIMATESPSNDRETRITAEAVATVETEGTEEREETAEKSVQELSQLNKAANLYQQGYAANQIAKDLRIGNAEAQLMVHLFQQQANELKKNH